jgi:A/G-specific adenine glycosylase
LAELPGIGPYAAAAISCFVFGYREIALDVNVARIISRVFDLLPLRGELRKNRQIIKVGQTIISGPRPRDLNWALLDLGALVCRPRPKCNACPLSLRCSYAIHAGSARHEGRVKL